MLLNSNIRRMNVKHPVLEKLTYFWTLLGVSLNQPLYEFLSLLWHILIILKFKFITLN